MATIGSAGNSETACLQLVKDKGYTINYYENPIGAVSPGVYSAEKDGETFAAEDGMALLGLVTLWETHGDNWQRACLRRGVRDEIEIHEWKEE